MSRLIVAILFSMAIASLSAGFYNTYRLGVVSEKKVQSERRVEVVKKQRDLATRPGIDRAKLIERMLDNEF